MHGELEFAALNWPALYSFLDRGVPLNPLFAHRDFPELQLSAFPAERQVQVRMLDDVLAVVEQRQRGRVTAAWGALPRFAEAAAVAEATDRRLAKLPVDVDFGSFEELKSQQDKTGVVRLR